MKLPLSREAHIKAKAVGLEASNSILPTPLYADPKLPLAATLTIFKATLESNCIALKDKKQVTKAGDYLAEELVTIAMLVDKSKPAVVNLHHTIL